MRLHRALCLSATCAALACEARHTNDYGDQDLHYPARPDAGLPDASAPDDAGDASSACMFSKVPTCTAEPVIDACSSRASEGTATITGRVVVPEGRVPGGSYEARGTLAVLVLSGSSMTLCPNAADAPAPVALLAMHCTDLRAGMVVPFEVSGVPVSSEPYGVLPTLDVNGNFALDACDMAGLPTKVTLSEPGTFTLPDVLALDLDVPLVASLCKFPSCE